MENNQPVPPVTPTFQPQPIPQAPVPIVPPKKNKKLVFIIGGVLLVILLILLAIYFFMKNGGKLPSQITPTPSPAPTVAVPTPTIIPSGASFSAKLTLIKGKITPVPGTDVTLTYKEGTKPNENCADCIASTTIEILQKQNAKMLSYSCGGIAGDCINLQEGFGYKVELSKEIDEKTIEVLVTK
jgi:hypothetical protein